MDAKTVTNIISAILALGLCATTCSASTDPSKEMQVGKGMEKCYGIAKSGQNDCGTVAGACAGDANFDNDKQAWIALPKGTCHKIVGGSLKREVNPS